MAKSPTKKQLLEEKHLFETWLDIYYACQTNNDVIHDMELELKIFKKHRAKMNKSLKRIEKIYKDIYGNKPSIKRK